MKPARRNTREMMSPIKGLFRDVFLKPHLTNQTMLRIKSRIPNMESHLASSLIDLSSYKSHRSACLLNPSCLMRILYQKWGWESKCLRVTHQDYSYLRKSTGLTCVALAACKAMVTKVNTRTNTVAAAKIKPERLILSAYLIDREDEMCHNIFPIMLEI